MGKSTAQKKKKESDQNNKQQQITPNLKKSTTLHPHTLSMFTVAAH